MKNAALRSEGHKCLLLRLERPPGTILCDPVNLSVVYQVGMKGELGDKNAPLHI